MESGLKIDIYNLLAVSLWEAVDVQATQREIDVLEKYLKKATEKFGLPIAPYTWVLYDSPFSSQKT